MDSLASMLILSVVQAISEWLPISSSGHLVLFENVMGFYPGLDFSVALHFGTLLAVMVYFWKDLVGIVKGFVKFDKGDKNLGLGVNVLIATLPAVIVGFLFLDTFESIFDSVFYAGMGFVLTAALLGFASFSYVRKRKIDWKIALFIGIVQVLALFPGVSRSGVTIAAALLLGVKEKESMKFSFLMAIPVVLGANIVLAGPSFASFQYFWATVVSFAIGLVTIHLLYTKILTERKNLRWFALYALILGLFVLMLP